MFKESVNILFFKWMDSFDVTWTFIVGKQQINWSIVHYPIYFNLLNIWQIIKQ